MMYGREKSDSAIVAKKPANKVGTPTAERVEPRAGAEGNAGQQRTRRAQNRESVSQKLERVRQAAKLRKKERLTALLHHVTIEFLEQAFYALRRKAAPGIDGQTWTDYEGNLESHLQNLHGGIHSGAYKALPVRRRFVFYSAWMWTTHAPTFCSISVAVEAAKRKLAFLGRFSRRGGPRTQILCFRADAFRKRSGA